MLKSNKLDFHNMNITITIIFSLLLSGCYIPLKYQDWNDGGSTESLSIVASLLRNNQKVSIAIIAGSVTISGIPNAAGRASLLSKAENSWIRYFTNFPNFSLVSRSNIQNILDETNFHYSGLVSDSTRTQIGKLTGATHLLIIEGQQWYGFWIDENDVYWKLIEIQSGRILSVDKVHNSRFRVL